MDILNDYYPLYDPNPDKENLSDSELSDREEDFIDRAVNPRINSRLGCQCVLQAGTGTIEITLPDQTQFLGE
jgi:ferredoxin